jgi:hypothetical protein
MPAHAVEPPSLSLAERPEREEFYRDVLVRAGEAGVPYLVGGAFAFATVTGIAPRTKDIDLFVRRRDRDRLLEVARAAGYDTEVPFPHWLAKILHDDDQVDVIYSSGNGESPVDDHWFAHARPAEVCGIRVSICPVEEMIWTKAFIMERERYDGGDVAHLLRCCAETIDWDRLLARFGEHHPLLLSHLILFGFVYPSERARIPAQVVRTLQRRWLDEWDRDEADPRLCRGGLISRAQYYVDFADWGYRDARVAPLGRLSPEEVAAWTDAAPAHPRAARSPRARRSRRSRAR